MRQRALRAQRAGYKGTPPLYGRAPLTDEEVARREDARRQMRRILVERYGPEAVAPESSTE
jgi:hypothetical protein